MLLEKQMPKEFHEVPMVDSGFIEQYIRKVPHILSDNAVPEQVSHNLRCKSASFTSGVVNDSSMVEVGFGR